MDFFIAARLFVSEIYINIAGKLMAYDRSNRYEKMIRKLFILLKSLCFFIYFYEYILNKNKMKK